MSRVVILQHVAHEGPGRIVPVLADFGIPCEVRKLHQGDAVPAADADLRALIILGGPMGVSDLGSSQYPFLDAEVALLQQMIAADRPVLGICLGAQLLAHAGGARVYRNVKMAPGAPGQPPKPVEPIEPLPEFGWGPVTFPFPGGTEPIVFGLADGSPMFHWHNDTFDLPRLPPPPTAPPPPAPPPPTGNALISSTPRCRNQAFRFKNRLFGFQYHFEMTPEGIEALLAADGESAKATLGSDALDKIRRDTQTNYPRYERQGNRVLANFVQFLKVY